MQLEDYFDFLSEDDIRIRGHRIGIDQVLGYYLAGYSPEEIQAQLPSLNLEEIHATITYYLHNRQTIDAYLVRLAQWQEQRYQAAQAKPSPLAQKIIAAKQLKTSRQRTSTLIPFKGINYESSYPGRY